MSNVTIKKVETKKDLTNFIDLHYDLYAGNKYDAPNLFSDEWNTLSKDKNAAFEFCESEYYLAYKDGKLVGRVAAIINHKANTKWERKDVRFGWIDFIDDKEVSAALLDAVEAYGRSKGMTHIVGPLGFTDLDPEGMLTEGFEEIGTMATIYNYPYYQDHIKAISGYEIDNKYVENKMYVPKEVPEKYLKIGEMIQNRYNLHVRKITRKEVIKTDIGQQIFNVINETYKDLYGYSELSPKQVRQYAMMYLPMLDLDLVTLIEDRNTPEHKIIGVGITMPQLSMALQKCRRGRLLPFGWWHIIRALKFHKTNAADLLLVGVLPEYRSKGANSLLFTDLIPRFMKLGWEWGETQVQMENNINAQTQWGPLKPIVHKRRICWRKAL